MGQDIVLKFGEVLSCKQTQVETIKIINRKSKEERKWKSIVLEKGFYSIKKYIKPYYILKKLNSEKNEVEYRIVEPLLLWFIKTKKVHVARLYPKR